MKKITLFLVQVFFITFQTNAQNTYVPDDNFEQALIDLGYDTGPLDDYVLTANINTVTTLNLSNKTISDLTGLEHFVTLETLYCINNTISSIDLSNNVALELLFLNNNALSTIDLSNNVALRTFYCADNNLSALDVSNNLSLEVLICVSNNLSVLDVSQNLALVDLNCSNNSISVLDVTNNVNLEELQCVFNSLSSLDVSGNLAMTELYCYNNAITSLDVTNNNALVGLDCSSNDLTSLTIKNGNNSNLFYFNAVSNSSLSCIEVDNESFMNSSWATAKDPAANYSENCTDLSVSEASLEPLFSIYPNPVNDVLTIDTNLAIDNIVVTNLQGKVVLKTRTTAIDTRHLESGLYFVKIDSHNNSVIKKIIKH